MNHLVHKATEHDIDKLIKIFQMYRAFYDKQSNTEKEYSYLQARLKNNESVIFYIEKNDIVVAFIQLYETFSTLALETVLIINDLYVVDRYRKMNFGKELMLHVLDYAKHKDYDHLTLETSKDNLIAQSLYKSLGFETDTQFLVYTKKNIFN